MNPYYYKSIPYELPSNIQNVLRLNKGKKVLIYTTFKTMSEQFSGIIENSNLDHIIISNPESGHWYLIPTKYIDYIEFDENITFEPIYN